MVEYEPMPCPGCGSSILPDPARVERPRTATSWATCYFRCACGVGFSNAMRPADRRKIMRSPEENVPEHVRAGLSRVLSASVNVRNRAAKREHFCSASSEDAITWTLFSFLRESRQLDVFAKLLGSESPGGEPVVSLWGAPMRELDADRQLSAAYVAASSRLGEDTLARSEPDVIIAWDDLVVVIEAKHQSTNPLQPGYRHFDRYLDDPSMWSTSAEAVKQAGLYELTRNWRLGLELAGSRPFALLNLGPAATRPSAQRFAELISATPARRFCHILWLDVLEQVVPLPASLQAFLVERGVTA